MGAFRGAAAISWVDSDDINTERVLLLREPLRELRPAHQQAVYAADSLDFTQRQVFTVATGVDELVGRIRWMDDQQGLLDLIKAGSKGRTLTYLPNLADPTRSYACLLISPLSPLVLGMDSENGVHFGELEAELRLRLTSGASFGSEVWSAGLLFEYIAGGSLRGTTYSRATTATYRDKVGALQTAAAGAPRVTWTGAQSRLGLEAARTNAFTKSQKFDDAAWTKTRASITADAIAAPDGTLTADKLIEDVTATNTHIVNRNTPALTDNTLFAFSCWAKAAERTWIHLNPTNKTGSAFGAWFNLSTGVVGTTGVGVLANIASYASGWLRCGMTLSAGSGASTPLVRIGLATGDGASVYSGDGVSGAYIWGAQFETDQPCISSYVATDAATVTRNADSLSFPYTPAPQALWWYHKFVELGTNNTASQGYAGIGDAGTGSLYFSASSITTYQLTHHTTADVTSTVTLTPLYGDTIELLGLLYSDGSVQLLGSKNGATEVAGSRSAANTLLAAWAASTLRLNARSPGTEGFSGVQVSRIGAGTVVNTVAAARNHP